MILETFHPSSNWPTSCSGQFTSVSMENNKIKQFHFFQVEQVERGLRQAELEGKRKTEEVQAVKNKVGCLVGWSRLSRTRLVAVSIFCCCFDGYLAMLVVCSLFVFWLLAGL